MLALAAKCGRMQKMQDKPRQATLNPRASARPPASDDPAPSPRTGSPERTTPRPRAPSRDRGHGLSRMPERGARSLRSRGVIELGGFVNLSGANNFTSIQASPTAGWFLTDNFQLSGDFGVQLRSPDLRELNGEGIPRTTRPSCKILTEPSYHFPFSSMTSAFVGIGWAGQRPGKRRGLELGFDLRAPSRRQFPGGPIRASSAPPSSSTSRRARALQTNGGTLLGVNMTYGLQAGYTVMW